MTLHLPTLLKLMVEQGASDLHITAESPPQLRIDCAITPLRSDPLKPEETKQLVYSVLTEAQKHRFEAALELDSSFGIKNLARFRANVYMQRGSVCAVFRAISHHIPELRTLGLPASALRLTQRPYGLVLITGPTGSGKSTTLASMIDFINRERSEVIVTIEDPIEYLHTHQRSVVNQREVLADTLSFADALRHVLRQDPDIVLIGEMRDHETIEAAIRLSETGHLTFATLHTNDAVQAMHRIIDVFPATQQVQVRAQLSYVLIGVVCQQLLPRIGGKGRVLASEILLPNDAVRNLIREDKLHQIYSQMQIGQREHGMQTMNQSLAQLVRRGLVSQEDARRSSARPDEFDQLLKV